MKQRLKRWLFGLIGKDPEAVVIVLATSGPEAVEAVRGEVARLIPDRELFVVEPLEGSAVDIRRELRRRFRHKRVGMLAVLFGPDARYAAMRRAAFLFAPTRILAFNARLERHHLKLSCWIASWLFLRGVPLDRIWLRPWWLWPWKKDRSVYLSCSRILEGRPPEPGRHRVGIVSPYFPFPLSHGGAVRIFHLLRELAREFDVYLFAFTENQSDQDLAPVMEFCAGAALVPVPRYREPRWSSLLPPEVCEYRSPAMRELVERYRREWNLEALQVEYTYMASYGGDVLVEHDVTFDLYDQIRRQRPSAGAWWNWWRWARFERAAVRRFRRVVTMSEKDAALLGAAHAVVIPNGVDLERFRPEPERDGRRLLFIGSFRHFPNVTAYRFFASEVWPRLRERFADMTLTVVSGPDGRRYLNEVPKPEDGLKLLEFVRDVRPLYVESNIVVVPTLESAGTNLKVLEAMAMERAVVSTATGCAGLGLAHGESVWIAGTAEEFGDGVARLAENPEMRRQLAVRARQIAEERFDWSRIGEAQRRMIHNLLNRPPRLRSGKAADLERITIIQELSPEAAHWKPRSYLDFDLEVAELGGRIVGFLVCRATAPGETEILNIAVDPACRRCGVATALLESARKRHEGELFLEVRESNQAAQTLYKRLGYRQAGVRPRYYENPSEAAIVMRLQSC